ncbi:MAG: asparagine synthase C-terminal domain-containing protein, partial [Acidobacteriales bacterium]|nr:asparagine synthase C-terminal domain-containing protein [Terriglobales bacterium]
VPQDDDLRALQFLELRSSLPDELLLYGDKLSMAHGLEVRVPYLDHEIVEYVERLSSSFKVRNGSRKWLHRKICRRFLPEQFVSRNKLGFETPSGDWLQQPARGTAPDLRDGQSEIYQFLRYESVQSLLSEHRNGAARYSDFLFSLLALEMWLRALRNRTEPLTEVAVH